MYRKRYCTTPGVGGRVSNKFYVKVLLCDNKAQSGELSCMQTGFVFKKALNTMCTGCLYKVILRFFFSLILCLYVLKFGYITA